MVINLLPSEQKSKFKKQKSASYSKTQDFEIEMTGAEKLDKNKPGIKKAGVLSFFKQVVQKPKEDKKEEVEEKELKKMPETKVILKQKITYKNIFGGKPKVEYHVPDRKPVSFKQKSGFGRKVFSDTKEALKLDQKVRINKGISIKDDKTQFPEYHSISTEKVLKPEHIKAKKAKIIEVSSADHKAADKKMSAWLRFTVWLSGLFGGAKKVTQEFKDPDKISKLKGFPKPKDGRIEVIEEKRIIDTKSSKSEYSPKLDKTNKKNIQLQQSKKKDKLISVITPVEVKKEMSIVKSETKHPDKLRYQPKITEHAKKPDKQNNVVSSNFLEEKSNIKIDKIIPKKDVQINVGGGKESWFKKLMDWMTGLFSKDEAKKEEPKEENAKTEEKIKSFKGATPDGGRESVSGEEEKSNIKIEVPKAPKPQKDNIIPKVYVQEVKEPIYDKKADFIPPAPVVPPEPIVPPPPGSKTPLLSPITNKPQSVKESKDKHDTDSPVKDKKATGKLSEKLSKPVGFNGDQMNWEVNLIPEESKEKEIPISKILLLVMSLIIAVGVVFGGWLWANYYYNTISVTISEVDAEIANIQSQVAQYENIQGEAQELQQKIENVSLLLEKHIYWSEFFNKLEFYTLSKVYYSSMSADVNGTITLMAVSDTYENAIKQLYVFEEANDFVTSVTISDISKSMISVVSDDSENYISDDQVSMETDRINFNISLTINPALFYYIN